MWLNSLLKDSRKATPPQLAAPFTHPAWVWFVPVKPARIHRHVETLVWFPSPAGANNSLRSIKTLPVPSEEASYLQDFLCFQNSVLASLPRTYFVWIHWLDFFTALGSRTKRNMAQGVEGEPEFEQRTREGQGDPGTGCKLNQWPVSKTNRNLPVFLEPAS